MSEMHRANMQPLTVSPTPESSEKKECHVKLRIGNEVRKLNYEQAFVFGHDLMMERKFANAALILGELCTIPDHGPRAHILLAICKAGLSDYSAARIALDTAFASDTGTLAADIHDVIVNARMGFKDDARQDLSILASAHEELPTLCLWLGDLFAAEKEIKHARLYWELAVQRDRRGGAAALAAQKQLKKYAVAV